MLKQVDESVKTSLIEQQYVHNTVNSFNLILFIVIVEFYRFLDLLHKPF